MDVVSLSLSKYLIVMMQDDTMPRWWDEVRWIVQAFWSIILLPSTFWGHLRRSASFGWYWVIESWWCPWLDVRSRRCPWLWKFNFFFYHSSSWVTEWKVKPWIRGYYWISFCVDICLSFWETSKLFTKVTASF